MILTIIINCSIKNNGGTMKSMFNRSWSSNSSDGLEFEYQLQIQDGPPWGFRISGGREYGQEIKVSFIKPGVYKHHHSHGTKAYE